jgi:hypothetical protein
MAMSMNAAQVWNESEKYLKMAREHLNPDVLRSKRALGTDDEKEWLRISFLFPTLPEKSKTDLLSVRLYFMIARNQQERQKNNPKISAEYSEAMADEAAGQLREAFPSFSKVQREILSEYYLI